MLAYQRKQTIITELEKGGHVTVSELAGQFNTSPETIRRDLRELESLGKLQRTHGGASQVEAMDTKDHLPDDRHILVESSINTRKVVQSEIKMAICQRAAQYIKNYDTIYVDNSSTTLYLAQFIPSNYQITVVTNSIYFVLETVKYPSANISIFLLSGFLNCNNLSLYGSSTIKSSEDIFPSKAFISCAAINAAGLITDTSMYETDTRREMIRKSNEVFLLADHTKFHKSAPYFLANGDSMTYLITDSQTPQENVSNLEKKGVSVVYAD